MIVNKIVFVFGKVFFVDNVDVVLLCLLFVVLDVEVIWEGVVCFVCVYGVVLVV